MKSYQINLDALIIVVFLFVCSLAGNIYLVKLYAEVADENVKQKLTIMMNELNLDAKDNYINKLEKKHGTESVGDQPDQK
ncbi:MAG: hypothetical protein ACRBB6_11330 [Neptuniibacter sp.]